VVEGDRMASSYRVKDRQISVVNRHMGKNNFTITTLDNERTPAGTFLPRNYVVQYWDDATGDLRRVETFEDHWTRVGAFDLPASHTVTSAENGGFTVRSLRLSSHVLKAAK
jgi:hypothetical protein